MNSDEQVRIGVVVHDRGDEGEDVFAAFIRDVLLPRAGDCRIGGLYQETVRNPAGPNLMELVDVGSGARFAISQRLGSGSDSCCLDPRGLADASAHLRAVLESGVDLLIANKFAGAEADGEGLAPEIFEAVSRGIPVMLLVSRRYLPAWLAAAGGLGTQIAPRPDAMWAWVAGLGLPVAAASDSVEEQTAS
ncbi:DUF2478 domain-containing protein [Caenispirillum bisanense]|uniref:DUF2478 domain-containing protein n=1 Tax=Caenispirillum bisanense TaxID=414052 RepID=UPI0031DF9807